MINILWDASHIWGYLLLHAVKATGIPFRVLKGLDIAHSGLTGKMLLVPSSVAQSCLTLCDPMDHSMPGFPVHHKFLEFTQTHVH